MFLGIANAISGIKSGGLSFIKDNLKLYLDFKSNKSDTLKFPSEGSTLFNGTSDYITVSDSNSLSIAGSVTFSAWVKPTDLNSTITILSKTHTSNLGFSFQIASNDTFYFRINDGSNNYAVYSTATLTLGKWHHLCVSWNQNDGRAKFYLDGVESGRTSNSAVSGMGSPDNTVDLTIGRHSDGFTAEYYKGKLSNVAMWSRALEPEEIQSIMNKSYSQLKGVEKTSLVSWWALDSASNGVVQPATGEVLNSEINTVANATSPTNETNATTGWESGVYASTVSSVAEGYTGSYSLKVATNINIGFAQTSSAWTVDNDSIYKLSITWKTDGTNTDEWKYGWGTTQTNASYGIDIEDGSTDWVTSVKYIKTTSTSLHLYLQENESTSNALALYVDSISIKKVTSNTGLVTGATTTTSVYGGNAPILPRAVDVAKEGQADAIGDGSASFDGSSDFVQVEDSSVLDAPASWTLSAWIKIGSGTSGYDRIIGKQVTGGQCNYGIGLRNGNEFGTFINDGGGFNDSNYHTTDLTVGEWYHVTGTWNGTYLKSYINGILVETSSDLSSANASVTNTAPLLIGRNATNGDQYFKGNISQAGVWQGALTQSQIQSVMESTSYSKIPSSVKSTLGSELVQDSDWGEGVGWEDTGDNTWTYTSGTTSSLSIQNVSNLTIGKLYKVQYTITSNSNDIVLKWGGTNFFDTNVAISSTVGTYIYYGVATTNNFVFRRLSGTGTIGLSNISLKEVTNDIVAYYPLDGDNSIPALSFDGTDDTIQTSAHDTLVDTTYTFWAKSDVTGANGGLFGHGGVTKSSFHFNYFGATGGARFFLGGNYFKKWDIDEQDDGQWHHYAIIADADSIADTKLYVDGVEKTASTTSSSGNPEAFTQSLTIGSDAINGNEWEGYIAQFAVYSDLKDADFIKAQYDKAIDADFSSDTNLVGYWKMNNGTTVNDLSGNGNNGTVSGATLIQNAVALDSTDNNNDGSLN